MIFLTCPAILSPDHRAAVRKNGMANETVSKPKMAEYPIPTEDLPMDAEGSDEYSINADEKNKKYLS